MFIRYERAVIEMLEISIKNDTAALMTLAIIFEFLQLPELVMI